MHGSNSEKLSVEELVYNYNLENSCKTNIRIYEGKNPKCWLIKAVTSYRGGYKVIFDPAHELRIGEYTGAYYCNTMSELTEIVQYLYNESLLEDTPSKSEDVLDQKDTKRYSCFSKYINE